MGKSTTNGPCSTDMLHCQRVESMLSGYDFWSVSGVVPTDLSQKPRTKQHFGGAVYHIFRFMPVLQSSMPICCVIFPMIPMYSSHPPILRKWFSNTSRILFWHQKRAPQELFSTGSDKQGTTIRFLACRWSAFCFRVWQLSIWGFP